MPIKKSPPKKQGAGAGREKTAAEVKTATAKKAVKPVLKKTTKNNKRKPTRRMLALAENLADPNIKSVAEAGRRAGFAPSSIRGSTLHRAAQHPLVTEIAQSRINRALAHHKVTPEEIIGSAVFQMRSSMVDVLDDDGSFDYQKALQTGAADLLKKHKETRKTVYNPQTKANETTTVIEVELLTNSDARKEVANYSGLEKFAPNDTEQLTDEQLAQELFARLERRGFTLKAIKKSLSERFPAIDVENLAK